MPLLELSLRVVALTQLGLLAAVLLKYPSGGKTYKYAALLCVGVACYLLAPIALYESGSALFFYPVILMAILVPVFFWYFCNAVFRDGFVPHAGVNSLAGVFALVAVAAFVSETAASPALAREFSNYLELAVQSAKLLWILFAFNTLLRDWRADLVEPRRRLRRLVVAGAGCYILAILLAELLFEGSTIASLEVLNVSLILVVVTLLALHMLTVDGRNAFARITEPGLPPSTPHSPLAKQVVALMEQERSYVEDGLTIDSLARQLGTQPYLLRKAINGDLGYRNFNAFINQYRVREVAQRLHRDEYRKTPLLTLALDAGFRSIAPFNRAFKEEYTVTPSHYRASLEDKKP